jgi:hypothetical protein
MTSVKSFVSSERHKMAKEIGLPLVACVKGRLYKFNARNFFIGVYNGHGGFVGIRTKFGYRFLDTEYHWDQGPPYGTVQEVEDTGIALPEGIPLETTLGTMDRDTCRPMDFDRPVKDGGKGWYFTDTGEAGPDAQPVAVGNNALFEWLDKYQLL